MEAILVILLFILAALAGLVAYVGYEAFMYEVYFGFTVCLIFFLLCLVPIGAIIISLL